MTTKPKSLSKEASVERLMAVHALYQNPPTFKPGDLVVLNDLVISPEFLESAEKRGIFMPMVVLETVDDYSTVDHRTPPAERFTSQGFRAADISQSDAITFSWSASLLYVLAPAKMLSDRPTGTSH